MFYVRMQIDRLMCFIDLEMFLILKKGKLYIILSFWQILINVQLSGISVIKLQYVKWRKLMKEHFNFYLMTRNDLKKCTSINSFTEMIKKWEGPKCQWSMCDVLS